MVAQIDDVVLIDIGDDRFGQTHSTGAAIRRYRNLTYQQDGGRNRGQIYLDAGGGKRGQIEGMSMASSLHSRVVLIDHQVHVNFRSDFVIARIFQNVAIEIHLQQHVVGQIAFADARRSSNKHVVTDAYGNITIVAIDKAALIHLVTDETNSIFCFQIREILRHE